MTPLDRAFRQNGGRVIAALAARFRDLDLAEEAFADACARAAEAWARDGPPLDVAGWLYAAARRAALDRLRRREVRARLQEDQPAPPPSPEDNMVDDARLIPEERLRLIFICCHPAVAVQARAALALQVVCGLSARTLAQAFLVGEAAMAQTLVRAKRKIAAAGVPFELLPQDRWPDRLDAVLSTLEVAYAQAYGDAAGLGEHAEFAGEVLRLSGLLAKLLPDDGEVLALAALVRYAEARRPARLDASGGMVPLDQQDPRLWRSDLMADADRLLHRAARLGPPGPRRLLAAIHAAHAGRAKGEPTPWRAILALYDALLTKRPDDIARVNRLAALAQVSGPELAMAELAALDCAKLQRWSPFLALKAQLCADLGRLDEAREAYARAAVGASSAERLWLQRRSDELAG